MQILLEYCKDYKAMGPTIIDNHCPNWCKVAGHRYICAQRKIKPEKQEQKRPKNVKKRSSSLDLM